MGDLKERVIKHDLKGGDKRELSTLTLPFSMSISLRNLCDCSHMKVVTRSLERQLAKGEKNDGKREVENTGNSLKKLKKFP